MSEALHRIRAAHAFAVGDVEEARVGTNSHAFHDIVGPIRDPRDLTDAQFSANFSVALYLVTGGLAGRVLPRPAAEHLLDRTHRLPEVADIGDVARLLTV